MVLNILFSLPVKSEIEQLKSYVVDNVVLEAVNAATVSGAVLRCLTVIDIPLNKVTAFVTDGARYMKASFRDTIKPICTECVHFVCQAHSINLVGEELTHLSI